MEYLLSFLEGIITFLSPCLLPMLPVYLSYFAGGDAQDAETHKRRALRNALGFTLGFTLVFVLLGAAAGSFGQLMRQHQAVLNVLGGAFMILLGLHFMGVLSFGFLHRASQLSMDTGSLRFFTSVLFGLVFAVSWSPCVGTFLGSALMLAANAQEASKGIVMLLLFSLGLGVPFVISAVLIERLRQAFDAVKRHYRAVNLVSGLLLVTVGIFMLTGRLNAFLSLLTFR